MQQHFKKHNLIFLTRGGGQHECNIYMREQTRIVVENKQGSGVVNVFLHGFMETAKVMHHQYLAFSCPLCPVLFMAPIFLDTITYHPLGIPYSDSAKVLHHMKLPTVFACISSLLNFRKICLVG